MAMLMVLMVLALPQTAMATSQSSPQNNNTISKELSTIRNGLASAEGNLKNLTGKAREQFQSAINKAKTQLNSIAHLNH